jgi:predicted RecB family endonuclease
MCEVTVYALKGGESKEVESKLGEVNITAQRADIIAP